MRRIILTLLCALLCAAQVPMRNIVLGPTSEYNLSLIQLFDRVPECKVPIIDFVSLKQNTTFKGHFCPQKEFGVYHLFLNMSEDTEVNTELMSHIIKENSMIASLLQKRTEKEGFNFDFNIYSTKSTSQRHKIVTEVGTLEYQCLTEKFCYSRYPNEFKVSDYSKSYSFQEYSVTISPLDASFAPMTQDHKAYCSGQETRFDELFYHVPCNQVHQWIIYAISAVLGISSLMITENYAFLFPFSTFLALIVGSYVLRSITMTIVAVVTFIAMIKRSRQIIQQTGDSKQPIEPQAKKANDTNIAQLTLMVLQALTIQLYLANGFYPNKHLEIGLVIAIMFNIVYVSLIWSRSQVTLVFYFSTPVLMTLLIHHSIHALQQDSAVIQPIYMDNYIHFTEALRPLIIHLVMILIKLEMYGPAHDIHNFVNSEFYLPTVLLSVCIIWLIILITIQDTKTDRNICYTHMRMTIAFLTAFFQFDSSTPFACAALLQFQHADLLLIYVLVTVFCSFHCSQNQIYVKAILASLQSGTTIIPPLMGDPTNIKQAQTFQLAQSRARSFICPSNQSFSTCSINPSNTYTTIHHALDRETSQGYSLMTINGKNIEIDQIAQISDGPDPAVIVYPRGVTDRLPNDIGVYQHGQMTFATPVNPVNQSSFVDLTITGHDDKHIYYSDITENGSSGTPIWQIQSGRLVQVAVHRGRDNSQGVAVKLGNMTPQIIFQRTHRDTKTFQPKSQHRRMNDNPHPKRQQHDSNAESHQQPQAQPRDNQQLAQQISPSIDKPTTASLKQEVKHVTKEESKME